MTPIAYVTYAQVEESARTHFLRYGTKSSFKTIVKDLFDQRLYTVGTPRLPVEAVWSAISDTDFFELLCQIPVRNLFRSQEPDPDLILAEAIIPDALEVYALKYIPYITERMHTHNFFEVNYVMQGTCRMIFENETRDLTFGDFCIIAPHSGHDVTIEEGSVVLSLMLRKNTFETTFFKLLAQDDLLADFFRGILYSKKETANYMLFATADSPDVRNAFKDIFMECQIADSYSNTCVVSRVHLLFSLLLRRYSDTIQFYDHKPGIREHGSFTQVLKYIQDHYRTVTLEELAAIFSYNPSYLSRLFKKNTGQTLVDILTKLKMSKASDLLIHTNLKIEEIALRSGYPSVDHFSRLFKKQHGMSPRRYRQEQQSQVQPDPARQFFV